MPPEDTMPRPSRTTLLQPLRRTASPSRNVEDSYRGLPGAKLPSFRGQYTENVNAWLILIEDRFRIAQTPEHMKIASVSSLLRDDALTWYLWIRSEYPRPPSWEEFKKELRVKFAESPVRTGFLRKTLSSIKYSGPNDMERYISQFRSIEIQISHNDMTLGDKLEYFIRPFDLSLQRFIKKEHPNSMEIAYDMALDWATVHADDTELSVPQLSVPQLTAKASSDTEDLNVLNLNAINMDAIICHRCKKRGHFARDCRDREQKDPPHRRYKATGDPQTVTASDGRRFKLISLDPTKRDEEQLNLMNYEVDSDDSDLMESGDMYHRMNYGCASRRYNDG